MDKIILIKYGELTTKKANRNLFINILCDNVKAALKNYHVNIIKNRVRMFIETDDNINEIVDILVSGEKGGILSNVKIRIAENSYFEIHLDTDDANAHFLKNNDF